jgi:hypothetical protein
MCDPDAEFGRRLDINALDADPRLVDETKSTAFEDVSVDLGCPRHDDIHTLQVIGKLTGLADL